MKLPERTFIFLLIVVLCVGTFNIQVSAENDSSESSSCYSTDTVEDDLIFFMDEEEISSSGENFESIDEITDDENISDINEEISDKKENKSDINENISDIKEIIPDIDEESLPDDFYTEYPVGGIIDEEPIDERESVYDGQKRVYRTQAILPSEYITPDLPPLRRQSPYGTCWAFADTALAEINLMKKGYITDPDLSELHLAYFTYNTVTDPLGGTEGDKISLITSNILDFGGRIEWGLSTYERWIGVADEMTAPYSMGNQVDSIGLDNSTAYEDIAHIVNAFEEPIEKSASKIETNLHASLKKMILGYGAIGVNYYAYNSMSSATKDNIYNIETNAYYNPNNPKKTNHAVVIVGWNDNFPKTSFVTEAPGDGAFLVRNSWREGTGTSEDYSYSGYFWMSYYEASLGNYAYAAEFVQADNYDNNYEYDGGIAYGGVGLKQAANIYTTHAEGGETGELLEAVSFYTLSSNVDYTIDIYTDLSEATDPVSGTHVVEATTQGTTSYAGFYTIELSDAVPLLPDTLFSVVVTMQKNGANAYIGVENNLSYGTVTNSPGQSFIFSGGTWKDLTDVFPCGNFAIKAYTNNADIISSILPAKTDINDLTMINYKESYEYSGAECRQKTVKLYMTTDEGKKYLTEDVDYTVTYDSDDLVNCGTKYITYTGIGDFTGTITKSYKIRAYNLSRDLDLKQPCISVSFGEGYEPDEDGIYAFEMTDGEVFPEPQLTYTSSKCSLPMVKDVDYTIKYTNNTEVTTSNDLDSLAKITITGINNFIRNYVIYFYITPQRQSEPVSIQLSYDGNGANKGTVAAQVISTLDPKPLNTNKYIKNGSVFMGWAVSPEDAQKGIVTYKDNEVVGSDILEYLGNEDSLILYAVWRSEFYITYDTKGGIFPEGVEELNTYTFGIVQNLPKPVKEGHRFVGWFTDDTYQTQLFGIKSRTSGDYNLVAKWEAYPYTITFNGNGNTSGEMSVQAGEYGTPITLNGNTFERTGYKFVGWNSVKSPTSSNPGTSYSDKETIIKTPSTKNVRYIFYAQWEKISK